MNILEIALTILVSVWTVIFLMIAIAGFLIYRSIKKGLDKVNKFLDTTEEIAESASIPTKVVVASIVGFMAKNGISGLKNVARNFFDKKRK